MLQTNCFILVDEIIAGLVVMAVPVGLQGLRWLDSTAVLWALRAGALNCAFNGRTNSRARRPAVSSPSCSSPLQLAASLAVSRAALAAPCWLSRASPNPRSCPAPLDLRPPPKKKQTNSSWFLEGPICGLSACSGQAGYRCSAPAPGNAEVVFKSL